MYDFSFKKFKTVYHLLTVSFSVILALIQVGILKMHKFSLVALFGLTIISTLHTSFAIIQHGVLHQYNEIFALFGDLDQQMGTNSRGIFVQNANNGNAPHRGARAAATTLQQHAVVRDYYRNNAPLRTAVVDRIKLYFSRFREHDIPLIQIPGFNMIQQFRLQLEFPPAIPVRRPSGPGSSSGGAGSSGTGGDNGSSSTGGVLRRMGGSASSKNLSQMGQ